MVSQEKLFRGGLAFVDERIVKSNSHWQQYGQWEGDIIKPMKESRVVDNIWNINKFVIVSSEVLKGADRMQYFAEIEK